MQVCQVSASEKKNFEFFSPEFTLMSPRQLIKLSDSTNQRKRFRLSHMKHGGLLNKLFVKKKIKYLQ